MPRRPEMGVMCVTLRAQSWNLIPRRPQVVECRRVLKWTYAYGYYSFEPQEERAPGAPPAASKEQQVFFEYNQARPEP